MDSIPMEDSQPQETQPLKSSIENVDDYKTSISLENEQNEDTIIDIQEGIEVQPPTSQPKRLFRRKALFLSQVIHKDIKEIAEKLETNVETGLTEEESQRRRAKFGRNALPEEQPLSLWKIFLKQFYDFMILILTFATIVSVAIQDYVEAGVIALVVLVNVIIGFLQESKAEKTLAALKTLSVSKAGVIRNGERDIIDAISLVPGDIVVLEEGNRVPADIRLSEAVNLQVTESVLTGESEPVDKHTESIPKPEKRRIIPLGDRNNMCFMSTVVTRGRGTGIVITIGKQTEVGKISKALRAPSDKMGKETTRLQQRLNKLGKTLVMLSVVLCIIVIGIGVLRVYLDKHHLSTNNIVEFAKVGTSLAVSVIPEGLVAVVTVTMALGVQRMAKRNAVVRKLPAVETLGSVTTLSCDKTGTLTEGKMKVEEFWFPDKQIFKVGGTGTEPAGGFYAGDQLEQEITDLPKCLRIALLNSALCNNAVLQFDKEKDAWEGIGDPTEVALLVAAKKGDLDKEDLQETTGYSFMHEAAFDSNRKKMTVVYKVPESSDDFQAAVVALTKGATEAILKSCTRTHDKHQLIPMDDKYHELIKEASISMASKGLRVLALAYRELEQGVAQNLDQAEDVEKDLIFLGLVGLRDPPRESAIQSIRQLSQAGIKVYMITGDHERTGFAIAAQLGIIDVKLEDVSTSETDETIKRYVMNGHDIESMDRSTLAKVSPFPRIFARVSPTDKLKIIDALHIRGEINSMIGDGVNDAPAIKQCDVGVSMGKSGTDLAKQSASIILMDDDISTLVAAIEEGRRTYDNIHKFILYLLSCNSSEIWVMLFAVSAGLPTPFTAVMILWANLIIDVPPALALGIDPPEPDILKRPPRNPRTGIFTWKTVLVVLFQGFTMAGLTLGIYALAIYVEDYPMPADVGTKGAEESSRARGLAFINLGILHLLHAFLSRSVKRSAFSRDICSNRWLIGGFLFSLFFLVVVCYIPGLKEVLNQWPLNGQDWLHIGVCVVIHILLVEIQKWIFRRYEAKSTHYEL